MMPRTLRLIEEKEAKEILRNPKCPVVFLVAPNFEDRSTESANWFMESLGNRTENVAVHVIWFQSPGVNIALDRIKAANRDFVINQKFRNFDSTRISVNRVDFPLSNTEHVLGQTRRFAQNFGNGVTLIVDISSMPRRAMHMIMKELLREKSLFKRIICIYTAARDYPEGVDRDMVGGVHGYKSGAPLHTLLNSAGIINGVVSLAGAPHEAAPALDTIWAHRTRAKTTVNALVLLNRENFLYSYRRLSHAAWALEQSRKRDTRVSYAFAMDHICDLIVKHTEYAINEHKSYLETGGEQRPLFVVGGFGPKPLGLAALLAQERYIHGMGEEWSSRCDADVLAVSGGQYTTRYSHGARAPQFYEIDIEMPLPATE